MSEINGFQREQKETEQKGTHFDVSRRFTTTSIHPAGVTLDTRTHEDGDRLLTQTDALGSVLTMTDANKGTLTQIVQSNKRILTSIFTVASPPPAFIPPA